MELVVEGVVEGVDGSVDGSVDEGVDEAPGVQPGEFVSERTGEASSWRLSREPACSTRGVGSSSSRSKERLSRESMKDSLMFVSPGFSVFRP